ncbi:hypothetical protein [Paenibacillus humicola]|uniref:hypothetical protein n=1 Tax=Paenibacillus humicola TaxID=3110540 RepID=UPI00237AEB64|nr:hypothetical protein [Paenibacillus humicola]
MILYGPVKFDDNEWFFIVSSLISWSLIVLLPKRLAPIDIVSLWVLNYALAQTADFTISVPPYDFYDVNDRPQMEITDFLFYFFTYPPAGYFVVYIYSMLRLSAVRLGAYLVLCGFIAEIMEWGAARWFHVFTYKGWSPWYSGPVYILVFLLNLALYKLLRRYAPLLDRERRAE